jgi:hypothetical protein
LAAREYGKAAKQYNRIGNHENALGAYLYGKRYEQLAKYLSRFVSPSRGARHGNALTHVSPLDMSPNSI